MGKRNSLDEIRLRKPLCCTKCGGQLKPLYSGVYECQLCRGLELDDFGKVKLYIEEHGKQPAIILAEKTGVPIDTIEMLLKTGRLEIPEGSDVYISCERCGCDIRYGRYCPECMKILVGDVKRAFFNENIGEKPKQKHQKSKDQMHIADWLKKKDY